MTESQEYKKMLVAQLLDHMFGDNIIVETIDKTNEITASPRLRGVCLGVVGLT